MKKGLLPGAWLLLATALPLAAQQPVNVPPPAPAGLPAAARLHRLSLEATALAHGGETRAVTDPAERNRLSLHPSSHYAAASHGGSRDASAESMTITVSKETLQIGLRNFGPTPDTAQIECYFIASPVGTPYPKFSPLYVKDLPKEFIFDHSVRLLTAPANATSTLTVASTEVRTFVEKSASTYGFLNGTSVSSGSSQETGTKPRGWIVRLVADGKVLGVCASTSSYEDLGKDDARLQALLAVAAPDEPANRRTVGPFTK